MTMLELHAETHVQKPLQRPEFATCQECYRSFRPKSEDQYCLQLCDSCADSVRNLEEKAISVHVKALPHN